MRVRHRRSACGLRTLLQWLIRILRVCGLAFRASRVAAAT
jgi:hypothetical protein